MCTSFSYRCYYEKHPRKRSKLVAADMEQNLNHNPSDYILHEVPKEERHQSTEDVSKMRSMEANSGIAFTRLLSQRLDPAAKGGGAQLFSFGWNLGAGSGATRKNVPPVTDLIGFEAMSALAKLYFANIHPLYGFIDQKFFLEQMELRWTQPAACVVPDHMFANVAAGGSLFGNTQYESLIPALVEMAKEVLESTSLMRPPNLADVQSWLMRCLYMRATEHPHAVHTASCIMMHLVEAIGLHQEVGSSVAETSQSEDAELRRRTFWVARMLNTWVSFEYGRTRVHLRGITAELPTPWEGDFTTDYIQLYSLSSCLDPERDEGKWEDFLRAMENHETRHDGIELSRANLSMCGYRRLRLANPNLSSETINRIIKIGLDGLEAAKRMTAKDKPWWHVANVPFQVVCVFLAMDVRESLAHVASAIRVLEEVVERFQTVAMKEALKTARFLVRLSKKRKDEDSEVLGLSLKHNKPITEHARIDSQQRSHQQEQGGVAVVNEIPAVGIAAPIEGTPGTASSEDWSLDFLNNSDFDWNFFLTADMPSFDGFAPDGLM
jgi:hypothetical protein